MKDDSNIKIGIIPVMISLYERLLPSLKSKFDKIVNKIVKRFADLNINAVASDVASTSEQIRFAINDLKNQEIDILVIGNIAYCESGIILEALQGVHFPIPILLWPIQEMYELTLNEFDNDVLALNHGVHGTQDLANFLGRNNIPFGVIHGHYSQEDFTEELREWALAARMLNAMRDSNPVQIGDWFDNMLDLQIENAEFIRQLDVKVSKVSVEEFAESLKNVRRSEIAEIIQEYKRDFDINDNVSAELLEKSARNECALLRIISEQNSSAVGINFLTLANNTEISDALHVSASRLMKRGIGYGGEGDFITAMFVRGLLAINNDASFTEIFSVDYANNRLVLKHWGEGNVNISRSKPRIVKSNFNDKISSEFIIAEMEFKPGRAVLANLNADSDGLGKLIIVPGEIMRESLPKITGPRAIFKPDISDVRDALTQYAYLGGAHHLGLIYMDSEKIFSKLSRLSNWNLFVIE